MNVGGFARICFAMGLALLDVAPGYAQAGEPQVETYDITGQTPGELRQQMNTLGPVDRIEHKHFDAHTTWHVSWHYRWERGQPYGCRITSAEAGFRATIVMPRLVGIAPADLRQTWDAYIEKLLLHEKGHVAIGEAARAEAERAIRTLPAAATCDELERAANEAGNAAIRKANGDDIAYDRETRHGQTQGAKW